MVQPRRVELAREGAGTQKGGLVTLAFFFGKRHHLHAKGQAFALARQFTYASHRHENAQPTIVFAAVANGVIVAAGQQPLGVAVVAVVNTHHVAYCVNVHLVETAVGLHPVRQALGAGAVRVGQVGHGQFTALCIPGLTVFGQALGPVPHQIAQRGLHAKLVVQADFGNAVDVAQTFRQLKVGVVVQPAGKGVDDLVLVQTLAARAAYRQYEGESELGVVVSVELLDACKLFGRAVGEPSLALFVGGFGGERLVHHGLACQFRVGANQTQLGV